MEGGERKWEKVGSRDAVSFQGSSAACEGLEAEMHRITKYPELERTHEDHQTQTRGPARGSPVSGLKLALPLGAANAVPDPQWRRRARLGQIWSMAGSLSTPAVLPHVLSSFPTPTPLAQQPQPDPPHNAPRA